MTTNQDPARACAEELFPATSETMIGDYLIERERRRCADIIRRHFPEGAGEDDRQAVDFSGMDPAEACEIASVLEQDREPQPPALAEKVGKSCAQSIRCTFLAHGSIPTYDDQGAENYWPKIAQRITEHVAPIVEELERLRKVDSQYTRVVLGEFKALAELDAARTKRLDELMAEILRLQPQQNPPAK